MGERELATLGGGCFWCIEAVFEQVEGVLEVVSGYTGGAPSSANYKAVCRGDTGHVEVVQVAFDPAVIGYREVLEIFFAVHDPTTLNRQGNDVGTQYRSAVFFHSEAQREAAAALIAEFNVDNTFGAPVVTALEPAPVFHRAEDYHQHYYASNAYQPYCQFVVAPKVAKLREKFAHRLRRGG